MLELRNRQPFAVGGTRLCFEHPAHTDRCVKVFREDRTPLRRRERMRGFRRFRSLKHFDDQWKEKRAYEFLVDLERESVWDHVPKYYGVEETDLGIGIVTELFKNEDGSFPQSLEDLLRQEGSDFPRLAIEEFKDWLRAELFLSRNLLPHNIIVVDGPQNTQKLVIVDGIGNSEFVPISTWFEAFARRKIERRIRFFNRRVELLLNEDAQ